MPRGDGTGPLGKGPFTGRVAGYCAGFAAPGYANLPVAMENGCRRNTGMGGGRGLRRMFRGMENYGVNADISQSHPDIPVAEVGRTIKSEPDGQNEIQAMKAQIDFITKSLAVVTEKLESIVKTADKSGLGEIPAEGTVK